MADTKISNLSALAAAPDKNDVFALVDTSASSTKKLEAKYLVRDSGGSGAIVTGAYTLTIQESMQAAGRNVANTFTAANVFAEIISASKGIAFPDTPVASDDANTLDDYEEGVWTPTYLGSTADPSVEYSTTAGKYTKVGRLVTCHFIMLTTAVTGGSGYLLLGGLPFVTSDSSAIDGSSGAGSVYYSDGFTTNYPQGFGTNPGDDSMYATYQAGNAATVLMSVANLSTGADSNALRGVFSYIID